MNILIDRLPCEIIIKGEAYPIRTDFRTWIRFSQMVENAVDVVAWAEIIISVIEGEKLPDDFSTTISALSDFYILRDGKEKETNQNDSGQRVRAYDYDVDAAHIYTAFLQQYGIDLTKSDMHWWVFKYLLDGISDDTKFGKIVQYRCTDTSGIKDKETKKYYEKLKRTYALPDKRTDREIEQDFAESLSKIL